MFILMDLQDLLVGLLQASNKQWGINIGGAVQTSTLPITFTNVFLAVASTSTEWCCPGCSATNTTVTTRAYQSNRPDVAQPNDVNWIVIGCQPQWGKGKTFSIPFPAQCLHVVATYASTKSSDDNSDITVTATSTTGYITHKTYETFFLALGHQPQWGYVKSTKVTFPIQFNIIYTVLGNAHGSNNSNNDHYFLASFSTTEASFNYSNMNFTGLSWIAIGSA